MPSPVEKPDRSVEELLEGLKESARAIAEGRTSTIGEVRERIEEKG